MTIGYSDIERKSEKDIVCARALAEQTNMWPGLENHKLNQFTSTSIT